MGAQMGAQQWQGQVHAGQAQQAVKSFLHERIQVVILPVVRSPGFKPEH